MSLCTGLLYLATYSPAAIAVSVSVLLLTLVTFPLGLYAAGRENRYPLLISCILCLITSALLTAGGGMYVTYLTVNGITAVHSNADQWSRGAPVDVPSYIKWPESDAWTVGDGLVMLAKAYPHVMHDLRWSARLGDLPVFTDQLALSLTGSLRLFNNMRKVGLGCSHTYINLGLFYRWTCSPPPSLSCNYCGYDYGGEDYWGATASRQSLLTDEEYFICQWYSLYTCSTFLSESKFAYWLALLIAVQICGYVGGLVLYPIVAYHAFVAYRLKAPQRGGQVLQPRGWKGWF
eukprot:GHVQ01027463.1.p1 GENE.GHVQ01027463.1~~GHVQ01027463.1.p1  ORF type:complete len:290 (-),score=32.44 GHVQ01027463.1:204-1073(-)